MKNTLKTLAFFTTLILFAFISCGEDDSDPLVKEGGPFAISELAGNWEATSASFISDSDNTNVDLIGDGGSSSISVQSNGRFTLTIEPADRSAFTLSGEMFWEKWEGDYYFAIAWDDYPGDWDSYGAILSGDTFSINGGVDTGAYDFDDDGTFESASISFTFVKV